MILTTKGRYAVMAMLEIAHRKQNIPVSIADVSASQNIPHNYLEQIFLLLRRSGLLSAVKGPGGGYLINKATNQITIAEIIQAVGENIQMTRCNNQEQAGCGIDHKQCIAHNLWYGLTTNIKNYLVGISLDDVINGQLL